MKSPPENVITVIKKLVESSAVSFDIYANKTISVLEEQAKLLENNLKVNFEKTLNVDLENKNNDLKKALLIENKKMDVIKKKIISLELRIKRLGG